MPFSLRVTVFPPADLPVDRAGRADSTVFMRILLVAMLLCALAASGCAKKKDSGSPAGAKAGNTKPGKTVVTPDKPVGRVATVNGVGKFVVLSFPTGKMPAEDQHLNIYRRDVKVAEVKITGPQRGENIVADIVSGEPEVSDEAREN